MTSKSFSITELSNFLSHFKDVTVCIHDLIQISLLSVGEELWFIFGIDGEACFIFHVTKQML